MAVANGVFHMPGLRARPWRGGSETDGGLIWGWIFGEIFVGFGEKLGLKLGLFGFEIGFDWV